MCTFNNRPYVVWAGTTHNINIGYYDGTTTLKNKVTLNQTTSYTPSCTLDTTGASPRIWIAWTGLGNLHLNESVSSDGKNWGGAFTDNGDTASSGIGVNTFAINTVGPTAVAWAGTDNPHHINWSTFGNPNTDRNQWTYSDVEATQCCYLNEKLYITWLAADGSFDIFYETWAPSCGGCGWNITSYRTGYQSFTGIGVTTVLDAGGSEEQVWIAWGEPTDHLLNVVEIV